MKTITGTILGIIKDNKILLLKRRNYPFIGKWVMPGGKMQYPEHIDECAIREAREETSLDIEFKRYCGVISEHLTSGEEITDHFLLFLCHLEPKDMNHVESEEGELKWFDLDSLEDHQDSIVPSDMQMIKQILLKDNHGLFVSVINTENGIHNLERFEKI